MGSRRATWFLAAAIGLGIALGCLAAGGGNPAPVAVMRLEGAIDVPSAEYLERALRVAQKERAQCLLILLDTPGGLGEPMQDMTKALLNAPLPTIVYVYPAGAFAMSAGTFVTLSAHIAAMHPASAMGAAHPIDLLSMPRPPEEKELWKGDKEASPSSEVAVEKAVNAFAQQARAIAEARGRNADWAEKAVRESKATTSKEALALGVVDLVASSVDELLRAVNGREVALPGNRKVKLETAGARLIEIQATPKERFLHVLADPNILLVLVVLAGLGLMFELQNPGAILPGVIGGLCLLLALYSMAVLPVNYAGLGLIIFAMLLFLADVKVASHGVLTVGGVASFVTGAIMLMDTPWSGALQVSWQVIIVMTVLVVLFFLFVVGAGIRAHMRKVQTGNQGLLGARGRALGPLSPDGSVLVQGERWRARAAQSAIAEGEEIEVVAQDGLTLIVGRRQAEGSQGAKV